MELSPEQGRVLGALVEKERATPQGYPLTDNALLAACNQTTSRDPVVAYDTATVRMAVRELRELGLLRTVHRTGERSDKHRHELESALALSPAQVALLAVLLLRGPQTLAELRSRSERLHGFATVEDVERELAVMADRDEPLVGLLPRQPGRKEARFRQLLVPDTAAAARDALGMAPAAPSGPVSDLRRSSEVLDLVDPVDDPDGGDGGPDAGWGSAARHDAVPSEPDDEPAPDVSGLAAALAEVVEEVADLRREVDQLRAALERATGG